MFVVVVVVIAIATVGAVDRWSVDGYLCWSSSGSISRERGAGRLAITAWRCKGVHKK